jgi:hypothetical protein
MSRKNLLATANSCAAMHNDLAQMPENWSVKLTHIPEAGAGFHFATK